MVALRKDALEREIRVADATFSWNAPRVSVGHRPDLCFDLVECAAGEGATSGIDGTVWYNGAAYDRRTIENITVRFVDLLARMVRTPNLVLRDVAADVGRGNSRRTDDAEPPPHGRRAVRPSGLQPYVRATSPTHARLVERLERLLGLTGISIQDPLGDLGSDERLYARFADQIAAWSGERLPPTAFSSRTTVASLVDELLRRLPRTLALQVQAGDAVARPPLFLLHGDVGGGGYYTRDLLPILGLTQPLYALHPHGVTTGHVPMSIEDMAEEYIACIRRIHPKGPYKLAGFCDAGLVAYAIACRMSQSGEPVSSLILISTSAATSHRSSAASRFRPQAYTGAMTLLWPQAERRSAPPEAGWRRVCGDVSITYIAGCRVTCLTTHINELAIELNRCLASDPARSPTERV
jgi:hypothetical protein